MKLRKVSALVLVSALLVLGSCSRSKSSGGNDGAKSTAAATYSWTVAMTTSEETLNFKMYEKFKELIEARSNGSITINIYPNGQLGNDTEQIQGLIEGSNDFSTTITSGVTSFVKEYGVFDLPNVFPNLGVMRKVLDDRSFITALNGYSESKNIRLMGLADAGFRETSSNKPINTVSDVQGLKIRVIQNPYHIAYWKALNANPLAMDFTEVYMGLQQKTIDAQENPYMNIVANKFYEVQDYIIETDHLGHVIVFLMNNKLYNGLPADVKTLVDQCVADSITYTRGLADESIAGYKKVVQDSGTKIITLSPEVKAEMQKQVSGVYDLVRRDIDNKLVDSLLNAVQSASK